ncbi:MotA/TolQ/ExbB proton channel family protein [Mesorhizobium sp. Cs1321R2N1]|uniref:MotA/TolQ/ExbB proton channel family protein n=1 Tax=Mesorhizobium sp. Cs1321R2N1 TaxID=3015174 RepID=UPI00301CB4C1
MPTSSIYSRETERSSGTLSVVHGFRTPICSAPATFSIDKNGKRPDCFAAAPYFANGIARDDVLRPAKADVQSAIVYSCPELSGAAEVVCGVVSALVQKLEHITAGAAGIVGLWVAGIAGKAFAGNNAFLCWLIAAIGALGILCVFLQRWRDIDWLATHVVRIGLLGTVVGLIVAFSAARAGGSADPNAIRPMIASVIDGMYVALYATLLGIATNQWLKINLRLLGNFDG